MERQIQESMNIIEESREEGTCLNLKSEWTGTKIPGLQVKVPKGVSSSKERVPEGKEGQTEMKEENGMETQMKEA